MVMILVIFNSTHSYDGYLKQSKESNDKNIIYKPSMY